MGSYETEFDPSGAISVKRSIYSQPSVLGFSKSKLKEGQLDDLKSKIISPIKQERIQNIDRVLKKNNSSSNFDLNS